MFRSTAVGASMLHLRRRLDKWSDLRTLPGHRADRARKVLRHLGNATTPRVQATYLRTICDGWCTKHRFQGHGNCLFGCGKGLDRLTHYAFCSVVGDLLSSGPNNHNASLHGNLDSFLCMNNVEVERIVNHAVGLYGLYRLFNGIRHRQFVPSEFHGAYFRFTQEAVR